MDLLSFMTRVLAAKTGQKTMARVMLNVAGLTEQREAIDVSELRKLRHDDRVMIEAFMDWAIANPDLRMCTNQADYLRSRCLVKEQMEFDAGRCFS